MIMFMFRFIWWQILATDRIKDRDRIKNQSGIPVGAELPVQVPN